MNHEYFGQLSDDDLLGKVMRLAGSERAATAQLVAALAEVDARRLYLGQGSSLFTYCTEVLRLSEHAAYGRIEAARAARRFPSLLDKLASGEVTLTAICLLAPHLNERNFHHVVSRAVHRSKREVEEIVAALRPRADAPAIVRKLPERSIQLPIEKEAGHPVRTQLGRPPTVAAPSEPSLAARATVEPLAPGRYKLQVTLDHATHQKLRRVQDLMRHVVPSGDLATILGRALDLLLTDLERQKIGTATRPRSPRQLRPGSRHIPAAVRRAVWRRDGGRCKFVGVHGPCSETRMLEFHHTRPFACGGESTEDNIELRCRAHNQYEADLFFGDPFIARESYAAYEVDSVLDRVADSRLLATVFTSRRVCSESPATIWQVRETQRLHLGGTHRSIADGAGNRSTLNRKVVTS